MASEKKTKLIELIGDTIRQAYWLLDDSEEYECERRGKEIVVDKEHFEKLNELLLKLQALDYDEGSYSMGPAAKVELALNKEFVEDKVVLSRSEYVELVRDSHELNALNNGGVDNWEWHWESRKDHYEEPFPDEPGSRAIDDD